MRALAALLACALVSGCAQELLHAGHPLTGKIWDTKARVFIAREELWRRAGAANHILLGEVHDNPEHHRLQRATLDALAAGGSRALAMEQFDSEHQASIDAARPRSAEAAADAGRFDRKGWNWPLYEPLVAFAVAQGWPLLAANLSRAEARKVMADPRLASHLPTPDPALLAALERDMVDGHCGHRMDAKLTAGMVNAQRARDARMAEVLDRAPGGRTVLIAGNGHVRRDRGVPLYISRGNAVVVGFVEVLPAAFAPGEYLAGGSFAGTGSYDYVWFTPRFVREDPCAALRSGGR